MAFSGDLSMLTPITPSMPICSPIQDQIDSLPITPPDSADAFGDRPRKVDSSAVKKALHVLATERAALAHLENLYASSVEAQSYLSAAINQILKVQEDGGKVVFTGIGKSRLIALKLVATFLSLSIHSVFLHPTDALHGDLGMIRPNDCVLMITFSGKTPELLGLVPHIPSYVPLMVLTSHLHPELCPLLMDSHRRNAINILLPAPIHESEKSTFGLSAPTTSTTVALALGDGLALAIADRLHSVPGHGPPEVFLSNHPGGAIGATIPILTPTLVPRMSEIAIKVTDVPVLSSSAAQPLKAFDVLIAAVRAPRGWVRPSPNHIIAPRRSQRIKNPNATVHDLADVDGNISIEKGDWISVLGECTITECKEWIINMRQEGDGRGRYFLRRGTLLGIVDKANRVSGVVEIEDVVGDDFFSDHEQS